MNAYRSFRCLLVMLIAGIAYGGNPPKNTGNAKVPEWVSPPIEFDDNSRGYPRADLFAPTDFGTRPVSSVALAEAIRSRGRKTGSNSVALAGSSRFRLVTPQNVPGGLLNPIYHHGVSNGTTANPDAEPATISNNIGGATRHVAGWFQFDGNDWSLQAGGTSTLTSTGFTPMAITNLALPAGYTVSADPWLSQSTFDDGVAPRRIYLTGIVFNRDANGNGVSPSLIRTWFSNDGGATWNNGWNVDSRLAGEPFLDKPATDVSSYSGTRGYFYAAYVEFGDNGTQRLLAGRNINGVSGRCNAVSPFRCYQPTFTRTEITAANFPQGAQVVTNPANGHVYILWYTQTSPSTIRMRRSIDGTMTGFEPGEIIVANNFNYTWDVVPPPNGMRSPTLPHARFNPVTNRLMLTWHGTDAGSQTSAVYYTSFDPDALVPGSPVPTRTRIDAAGHQHQPSLDNDDFGNVMITYYSNQADGLNRSFQLYGVYLSSAGAVLSGPTVLNATQNAPGFVGDYRDNFYWTSTDIDGARWNTSWVPSATRRTTITGVK
jgi:hypothetical protein